MADDRFREDFFQRIVDVNWESGLAVIFGKHAEDAPPQPKQGAGQK